MIKFGNLRQTATLFALFALISGLSATSCRAQPLAPPPPPPPPRGGPPAPPPPASQDYRSTISGVVQSFNYGPGGLDGFVLDRGTVIHFPPEYANQAASVAPVGSLVSASGWPHTGPAGDAVFDATIVTNQRSRASMTVAGDPPPPPHGPPGPPTLPPPPPPPPGSAGFAAPPSYPPAPAPAASMPLAPVAQSTVVSGTVRSYNYGIDGQVNGLILSDGTAVYFPPELANQVMSAVTVSGRVKVTGWPRTGPAGNRLIDAQSVTNSRTGASVAVANPPLPPSPWR